MAIERKLGTEDNPDIVDQGKAVDIEAEAPSFEEQLMESLEVTINDDEIIIDEAEEEAEQANKVLEEAKAFAAAKETEAASKAEDIEKAINEGKLPVEARNKTEQGVDLYEKRMPTKEELEAFFFGTNMQEVLGYKLGGSTLGTRKDGLARMIITELAQDGVMETIQEPAIAEEILSISQTQT